MVEIAIDIIDLADYTKKIVIAIPPVDLILHHGKIYTFDEELPRTTALAIRSGFIAAAGTDSEILALLRKGTRVIDLEGHIVLPGIIDAHIHFYDWSLSLRQVRLNQCRNLESLLAEVQQWAGDHPRASWIVGRGWNETQWPGQLLPSRWDLDRVTANQPAILWRVDMHAAVANSAALDAAGIRGDTPDPEGGIIGRSHEGEPNGLLWELAINMVQKKIPTPTLAWRTETVEAGAKALHRLGITSVHDQRMKDQNEGPLALSTYQTMRNDGQLKLRINCNFAAHDLPHLTALGLRSGFGDDFLRLGHIKLFADGTMGSRTAWMLEPYDQPAKELFGVNVTDPRQMTAEMQAAVRAGFPVSVHAIGDRANRVVLDIFAELAQGAASLVAPHRIEHVQIIDSQDISRVALHNLTASVQPIHITDDMDMAEEVLGERCSRVYRFRSLLESGALVAFGSDAPVADPNPFAGLHAAVYRQRPEELDRGAWFGEECLNLEQALFSYTLGGAKAAGWSKTIGSISLGKRADLIVLDRDIFRIVQSGITRSDLANTKVLMTFVDGELVYEA